jgi:hypothetical protein
MRTLRLTLLSLALAGITASSASADIISFRVTDGGELAADFGLVPFQVAGDVESDAFFVFGTATLVSGPGGPDGDADDDFTTYSYGAGTITLALSGVDDNGDPVDGTFVAPTLPFFFTVCEGCDTLFGDGLANDFAIELGPGEFSPGLAALFGVGAHTLGGFIDFGLEAIGGGPDSVARGGFDHRGYAQLDIDATVPEPASLLLMLGAAAGVIARRRRT